MITEAETVHSIRDSRKPTSNYKGTNSFGTQSSSNKSSEKGKLIKCNYCGRDHVPGKTNCPANGKKCNHSKGSNHFANVCRAKAKNSVHCISTSKDSCSSGTCNLIPSQSINAISELRETSLFGSTTKTELVTSSDYIFSIKSGKRGLPTVDICLNENEPLLMYIDTCCL